MKKLSISHEAVELSCHKQVELKKGLQSNRRIGILYKNVASIVMLCFTTLYGWTGQKSV